MRLRLFERVPTGSNDVFRIERLLERAYDFRCGNAIYGQTVYDYAIAIEQEKAANPTMHFLVCGMAFPNAVSAEFLFRVTRERLVQQGGEAPK